MTGRVETVTALLLVITSVSGGGHPSFYSGVPAPVVPQFYVYDTQLVAVPVAPDPARSSPPLPCPAEGFYRHPTNCSRFYRCVDYGGTGQFFSRYEFQCPPGQMFLEVGKDTCVPGDCDGVVPVPAPISAVPPSTGPVGDDPSSYPTPGTAPQPIDSGAPVVGGAYPQPGGSPPTAPVGEVVYPTPSPATENPTPPANQQPGAETGGSVPPAYPQPGAVTGGSVSPASPQPGAVTGGSVPPAYPQPGAVTGGSVPPAYPQPGAVTGQAPPLPAPAPPVVYPEPVVPAISPPPQPPAGAYPQPGAGTGVCQAKYVQDSLYCNIYHRCPDTDGKRYLCVAGTVFDQARQMCRLNDRENVCIGKQMFAPSAAFRADFPLVNQGGPAPLVGGQTFPSFSQGQTLPLFSQGQLSPTFGQGQFSPLFNQEQYFPSFDQGPTFHSFDQGQNFPDPQPLVYSAQVPSYAEESGGPQFAASDFVSGQDSAFFAQPSYDSPDYFVSYK